MSMTTEAIRIFNIFNKSLCERFNIKNIKEIKNKDAKYFDLPKLYEFEMNNTIYKEFIERITYIDGNFIAYEINFIEKDKQIPSPLSSYINCGDYMLCPHCKSKYNYKEERWTDWDICYICLNCEWKIKSKDNL